MNLTIKDKNRVSTKSINSFKSTGDRDKMSFKLQRNYDRKSS